MKEIIKDVFSKVQFSETAKAIADKGFEKLAAAAIGAALLDIVVIFLLFLALILVDIFTRCMAMSALLWRNMYGEGIVKRKGNLMNYIRWMRSAHHWRYIDSSALRDDFASKVITYFLLIIVAFTGDLILQVKHIPQFVLILFVMVLVCTETLSILENLNECGVSVAGEISALVKKRKEQIK
ncbi:MAG: phage holin family protein [Acidaminococcaceae bacterium]|nr:phage holin family protein [Acidaminococcaceae bacterium]